MDSLPAAQLALFDTIEHFYSQVLPLYDIGLGWVLPAIIGTAIGFVIPSKKTEV